MAILYAAQLSPTKPELIAGWIPNAPYYPGGTPALVSVGAYRFDDPAGEVGIETHLVRDADGTIYQVPLTYRSAPLAGARSVGEMEHSVLGHRHVYDATTDPVFVQQLLDTVFGGGREVDQFVHVDGAEPQKIENTAHAWGTGAGGASAPTVAEVRVSADGTDTVIEAGGTTVVVHHRPVDGEPAGPALLGEWDGGRGVFATVP
ncbi:maltokinase N-terminal cap-like domain-containing protein [Prescottella defluvii]|uniref:maltokinase N-terminal cap-like domain-containing protein n=1 Tax=Prescottella defluvii TaxID=1323361 RepID=UPI0004F3BC6F|nr:hypothetical protein [Prescottella defluvii]